MEIFASSDVHPDGDERLQMCSATGRELLENFIRSVGTQRSDSAPGRLVMAGGVARSSR